MSSRHRLFVVPLVGLVVLSLAACGRSDEERAAALCEEWEWDSSLSSEENFDAYQDVWATLDSDGTVDLEGMARDACPGHFTQYDRAAEAELDALREEYAQEEDSSASTEGDSSIADFLAGRGVTDSMVRQLGVKADETGYGLSPGNPLPFEQAQNFAFIIVGVCDEVASGQSTWSEQVSDDVSTGAPVGAAQEMNGYLQDVFCPQLP